GARKGLERLQHLKRFVLRPVRTVLTLGANCCDRSRSGHSPLIISRKALSHLAASGLAPSRWGGEVSCGIGKSSTGPVKGRFFLSHSWRYGPNPKGGRQRSR